MFKYINGKLHCESVDLTELAKKFQTPLFVYSKNQILQNYREFDNAFKDIPHIICYAVKANSNLKICRILFLAGAGADVTTLGELKLVMLAGVNPNKVVFAGVGKTESEIRLAISKNILMLNIESLQELKLVNEIAKSMKKIAKIALRINPNIDPHTHKFITTSKYENKFGIYLSQLPEAIRIVKKLKNLQLIGLHCHIGSQITLLSPFIKSTEIMCKVAKELLNQGFKIEYLNLGGGLGIKYKNETPPTPQDLANVMVPRVKKLNLKLILEPGRYIVGNSGVILTRVLFIKESLHKRFIVIDASMNEIIRPALYGAYHRILPVIKNRHTKELKFDIVGPICETTDFIGKDRVLPILENGALLAIMDAGAYCFSMSSQYNSRPRSAEILVDDKKYYIIRERESFNDLIKTQKL